MPKEAHDGSLFLTACLLHGDARRGGHLGEIERAFAIEIPTAERNRLATAGDLAAAIRAHVPDGGNRCLTTMAFYRLRYRLRLADPACDPTPGTRLRALPRGAVQAALGAMAAQDGLRLPLTMTGAGSAGVLLLLFSCPVVFIWLSSMDRGWLALCYLVLALAATGRLARYARSASRPRGCKTVGDLSRHIAAHNAGILAHSGARLSDREVWDVLVRLLGPYTSIPAKRVQPGMLLLTERQAAR